MLKPTRGMIRRKIYGVAITPPKPPVNCKLGQELATHMIAGMVDRFLEYGYLTVITRFSKSDKPLYTLGTPTHVEEVKVHVMPNHFTLYRDRVDADSPGIWMATVHLDVHFNVTDVDIQSEMATIDVAMDMHRVLTSVMNTYDSMGKVKFPIQQETTDCHKL